MCFSEFVGYTCGHQSPEVLRACPLTTQTHTNPVCASYGRRPILAPCMCPGCQRILHGRCVLTLEWEHHWMHERGVCGCPVIFPDLIQPRVITPFRHPNGQPSQPFYHVSPVSGAHSTDSVAKARVENTGKAAVVLPKKPVANNSGGTKKKKKKSSPGSSQTSSQSSSQDKMRENVPGKETTKGHSDGTRPIGALHAAAITGKNKPNEVATKIHSLYGAEWIGEHRQLHEAGSCKCAGDFSCYKTPEKYGLTEASFQALYDQEQAARTQLGSQYQAQKPAYPTWQPGLPNIQEDGEGDSQAGSWGLVQKVSQANLDQPHRSTGAIWQVDLTKSTNPLYNYACTEGSRMDGRAGTGLDLQGLDYIKPLDAPLPLVGLPIGAGPESPEYFQHMGSFEGCVLNPHKKNNEPEDKSDTSEVASIVATLLAEAKDSPESRLFRLHHKKGASF